MSELEHFENLMSDIQQLLDLAKEKQRLDKAFDGLGELYMEPKNHIGKLEEKVKAMYDGLLATAKELTEYTCLNGRYYSALLEIASKPDVGEGDELADMIANDCMAIAEEALGRDLFDK